MHRQMHYPKNNAIRQCVTDQLEMFPQEITFYCAQFLLLFTILYHDPSLPPAPVLMRLPVVSISPEMICLMRLGLLCHSYAGPCLPL